MLPVSPFSPGGGALFSSAATNPPSQTANHHSNKPSARKLYCLLTSLFADTFETYVRHAARPNNTLQIITTSATHESIVLFFFQTFFPPGSRCHFCLSQDPFSRKNYHKSGSNTITCAVRGVRQQTTTTTTTLCPPRQAQATTYW